MTKEPSRPALVTGGAGFIGSNLSDRLAREGHRVVVLDNLSRPGAERNAAWLRQRHGDAIEFLRADIRDRAIVQAAAARAAVVFHLAGQVAVTTSLVDPCEDFGVNVEGTLTLLEALRHSSRPTPLVFASTNKVYGDLADIDLTREAEGYLPLDGAYRARGVTENRPLSFCTPYGCSKGAADQYVLDYAHSFGQPTVVMRMSCIYGPRQMGSEDQGWVAHFLIRALRSEPISVFGDGYQVRDILYVDDAVEAYLSAWRRMSSVKGRAFNLGGGPENAISLNTLLAYVERLTGRKLSIAYEPWRPRDQRYYVTDASRARRELDWSSPLNWREGVRRLLSWLQTAPESPVIAAARPEAAE
jgi:CDP-paratose 2-epimerase